MPRDAALDGGVRKSGAARWLSSHSSEYFDGKIRSDRIG